MASEVSLTVNFQATKSGASVSGSISQLFDMAGSQFIANVQIIGTSSEALVFGDVSTIGWVYLKNLDATNYIEIDSATTMDAFPQKLLPGEVILLKPQTTTIYGKANTANVNLQVVAIEL